MSTSSNKTPGATYSGEVTSTQSHGTNRISKDEIVGVIKDELCKQLASWRVIATQFGVAYDQYGSDSDAFKEICRKTGFSKSTAMKLQSISGDARLNAPEFSACHAWTVLYEISRLTDSQLEKLKAELVTSRKSPTSSVIKRLFNEKKDPDNYSALLVVRVDVNAIKSGKFDGEAYANLMSAASDIGLVPYVRLDESSKFGTLNDAYIARLQSQVEVVKREFINQAINKMPKNQHIDLIELSKSDFKSCAQVCGVALPTQEDFYNQAMLRLEKKLGSTIAKISDPYRYANTSPTTSKEAV